MTTGIYKFTSPDGKVYVGQAKNIERRYIEYQTHLVKKHRRFYLSIQKFSFHSHFFEILEECQASELNERERYYQDLFDVCGENGLNCRLTTTLDKPGFLVIESRAKIASSHTGKSRTQVTKDRISKTRKERNIGTWNKGIPRTEEVKEKLRLARKGKCAGSDHPKAKVIIDTSNGIFFSTMKEASYSMGISYTTLHAYLQNRLPNKTNLIYA